MNNPESQSYYFFSWIVNVIVSVSSFRAVNRDEILRFGDCLGVASADCTVTVKF